MSCFVRHRKLILQEAGRPIDAIPILHPIERMEKWANRLQLSYPVFGCLAIPGSLNARTVNLFSIPPGKNSGAEARAFGS